MQEPMEKMHRRFEDDLDEVVESLVRLGGMAEEAVHKAVKALLERNAILAQEVIDEDEDVDRLELEIDHKCTDLLARQQPMARDLRLLTTALKITPDIERIADLASNIAVRTVELSQEPPFAKVVDIPIMAEHASKMLRMALDSFVKRDAEMARHVIELDDELDSWMEHTFRVMVTYMLENPKNITQALRYVIVAKYLERVGDQVTNVCEMIVYMVEGRVIKHMGEEGIAADSE